MHKAVPLEGVRCGLVPEAERERFISLGKYLCGDHWQTGLAKLTGLSRQYISKIANGERPVTDAVRASVVTGLIPEIKSLRQRRALAEKLLKEYER